MEKLKKSFKINKKLAYRKIDEIYYIVNPDDLRFFSFNEVATVIWDMLIKNKTIEETVQKLTRVYEVDEETAKNDVLEFIDKLLKYNLISEVK